MRFASAALPVLLLAGAAAAQSPTASRPAVDPVAPERIPLVERGLVNDGSFEDGTCRTGDSGWTCETDSDCDWIVDLVPLGLWNHEGDHVAWLGGACGGVPTDHTRICQSLEITGTTLSWYLMTLGDQLTGNLTVTLAGEVLFTHYSDFPWPDYFNYTVDVSDWLGETAELCFDYERHSAGVDNYFVDYVELLDETPAAPASFSTVKNRY